MSIITKKPMKLGTVNIPVGTEIDKLPEEIIGELTSRGLADIMKGKVVEPKPEKVHKEKKTEMGF
jgi:hypothetical protein